MDFYHVDVDLFDGFVGVSSHHIYVLNWIVNGSFDRRSYLGDKAIKAIVYLDSRSPEDLVTDCGWFKVYWNSHLEEERMISLSESPDLSKLLRGFDYPGLVALYLHGSGNANSNVRVLVFVDIDEFDQDWLIPIDRLPISRKV